MLRLLFTFIIFILSIKFADSIYIYKAPIALITFFDYFYN